ncbi:MAG: heme-binding domain-containing protein [Gloeobacteraceae cyanobacterium ES-bin-316]|nr:heme-binding domain-containing protein [Ferruginibacter sp.]
MIKKVLSVLLVIFLLIQFYPRAAKNNNPDASNDLARVHAVPQSVTNILKTSCYDCHSNQTNYPWYSYIQPVSFWLNDHIVEGKKELNFSEFATYTLARQFRKLEEINGEVKDNEMPLESYSFIHTDSKLSPEQKLLLANWTDALRDSMQKVYPPDSLVRKKK